MPEVSGCSPVEMTSKAGWRTTEFYVTIFTATMPLITAIFHRDFSGQVESWSVIASGIATASYALSRSRSKQAVATAKATMHAADCAPTAAGLMPSTSTTLPTDVTNQNMQVATRTTTTAPAAAGGSAEPMATVPLGTLSAILAKLDQIVAAEERAAATSSH